MKKSLNFFLTITIVIAITSCSHAEKRAKEVINKTGEVVGKSATEFIEGVSEGIDKTLQCEILLSQTLKDNGLQYGKFEINNDTQGGHNNILTLYIIFNKDFKGKILAKVFDKSGVECGRALVNVEMKAGEANYYDFCFDKRTQIEVKSRITIE